MNDGDKFKVRLVNTRIRLKPLDHRASKIIVRLF